jgi:hypothetical protein
MDNQKQSKLFLNKMIIFQKGDKILTDVKKVHCYDIRRLWKQNREDFNIVKINMKSFPLSLNEIKSKNWIKLIWNPASEKTLWI